MRTPQMEKAAQIRAAASARIAEIRANDSLSARGKARELASVQDDTRTKLSDLHRQERAELQAQHSSLENKLFGTLEGKSAQDVLIYRDATDRAAAIKTPEEALEKLNIAIQEGDTVRATAIGRRAVAREWGDVFTTWHDHRKSTLPDADDVLDGLVGIENHIQSKTAEKLFAYSSPEPAEIRGRSKASLNAAEQPVPGSIEYANQASGYSA